jgi:TolB protein
MFRWLLKYGLGFWILCLIIAFGVRLIGALLPSEPSIIFVSGSFVNFTVYSADIDHAISIPLVSNVFDRQLSLSPEGHLVFSRYMGNHMFSLFVSNRDGSQVQQLSPVDARDQYPAWSPDGSSIAFMSRVDGNAALFVMDSDGENRRNLSGDIYPYADTYPIWLPDNRSLMFIFAGTDERSTYIVDTVTGGVQNFTKDTGTMSRPVWSPNGQQVAFLSSEDMIQINIRIADVLHDGTIDSASTRVMTIEQGVDNYAPAWSPDGRQLAFLRRTGSANTTNRTLYLGDDQGNVIRNLTPTLRNAMNPVWSPDGTHLAFLSDEGGEWYVYVVSANGTGLRRISPIPVVDASFYPAWLP